VFEQLCSSIVVASYGVAKWHKNNSSMPDFKIRVFLKPAANMLNVDVGHHTL